MKTSQRGLDLIKHYEGIKLKPYRCPAGLWTVGCGHLIGDGSILPDSWNRKFTIEEVKVLVHFSEAHSVKRLTVAIMKVLSKVFSNITKLAEKFLKV